MKYGNTLPKTTLTRPTDYLVLFPRSGHTREGLTSRPIRFQLVREYLIAYVPHVDPLVVLGFLHGRRNEGDCSIGEATHLVAYRRIAPTANLPLPAILFHYTIFNAGLHFTPAALVCRGGDSRLRHYRGDIFLRPPPGTECA